MNMNNSTRRRSNRIISEKTKPDNPHQAILQLPSSVKSFVCPICSSIYTSKREFQKHYQREISNFLNGVPPRKKTNSQISFLNHKNDKEKPSMSLNQRNTIIKSVKQQKYERFSSFYLNSFKISKVNTDPSSPTTSENQDSSAYDLIPCAMCEEYVEIQNSDNRSIKHLAKCFSKRHTDYSLYSSSEDEGEELEENTEEFSWAGQTWIRTSSLLGDALHSQEGNLTRLQMADGDEILDVDGDDSESFGNQQYTEADVVPCATPSKSKNNANEMLRQAVCLDQRQVKVEEITYNTKTVDINYHEIWDNCLGDKDQFIDTLKETVDLKFEQELPKCTICMGPYNDPVVSTNCWHVCCSSCWLRALGAKKLCPKCNQIVSPSHLRKIYL